MKQLVPVMDLLTFGTILATVVADSVAFGIAQPACLLFPDSTWNSTMHTGTRDRLLEIDVGRNQYCVSSEDRRCLAARSEA